jgi:hypothetical protein
MYKKQISLKHGSIKKLRDAFFRKRRRWIFEKITDLVHSIFIFEKFQRMTDEEAPPLRHFILCFFYICDSYSVIVSFFPLNPVFCRCFKFSWQGKDGIVRKNAEDIFEKLEKS